ncbi:MAG: DUF202 domain-containing protein [Mycobacteriales bacterium]
MSPTPQNGDPNMFDADARFLLANERTLLAWVRTALTLQAGGVGLLQFATEVRARGFIGLAMLSLGAIAGYIGYHRYRLADAAIRRGALPPRGLAPELVALTAVALAVILAAGYAIAQVSGD